MSLLLKDLRKHSGMTQEDLAKLIGQSKRVVGAWEREETQITLTDAVSVCRALHCTPNDLCGWYIDHPEDAPRDASPPLAPDEDSVVEGYRACTPEWKRNIRMNVEAAKAASLNVPERAVPVIEEMTA